jgi:hypothetical protein
MSFWENKSKNVMCSYNYEYSYRLTNYLEFCGYVIEV